MSGHVIDMKVSDYDSALATLALATGDILSCWTAVAKNIEHL
jgi:hypothetical protein